MTIGILYSRSTAHPELMLDFIDGVKTFLKDNALDKICHLQLESIGFGGAEKEVYEKAEKLLLIDNADILVAYVDLRSAAILEPLIHASGKLLIVINPGANYPENWVPKESTIYLTLQHSFLTWLTGSLAREAKSKYGVLATTFYDCGYLHGAAMVNNFTATTEKVIAFNYINNQAYDHTFDINQLTDFLATNKETETLLCLFDSLPASIFYSLLHKTDASRLQLFVSPMMLEDAAFKNINEGFTFSIEGYLPWSSSQDNEANKHFTTIYKEQTKRAASIFSLLGWETGLLLKTIIDNCAAYQNDGTKIADHLTTVQIDSPRGEMILDAKTNFFITPVYKCSVKNNSTKIEITRVDDIRNEWHSFTNNNNSEGDVSGWLNTYLSY
jgi:branched-chain amino acid transport system substrate-binding protein